MNDAQFDEYLEKRTSLVDPKTGRLDLHWNVLDCDCSINLPVRASAKTDEERLRRTEFLAEFTWECTCQDSVRTCLSVAKLRRRLSADQ